MEYINYLNIYYYIFVLVIVLVLCFRPVRERINTLFQKAPVLKDIVLIALLVLAIVFVIVNGQYSPMYANF